jgi:hypothetical protein
MADLTTWGVVKPTIELSTIDKEIQFLEICYYEDDGSHVVLKIYSGIDKHFSEDFLRMFNLDNIKIRRFIDDEQVELNLS